MNMYPSTPKLRPTLWDGAVAALVAALAIVTALCFYGRRTGAPQAVTITHRGALIQTIRLTGLTGTKTVIWKFRWTAAVSALPAATVRGRTAFTPAASPAPARASSACRSRWSSSSPAAHRTPMWCWDRGRRMKHISTRQLALCAVLTALALGLSTLENLFPVTLLIPLPGVKLGLANIVTVFALYQLGALPALAILTARCLLGGLFAGNASAMLFSLLGGLTAMLVMILLRRLKGLSIYGVSIGGAAGHNLGQMAAALITLGNTAVLGYLPFLLGISLLTGTLTGFVSSLLFRAMAHIKLSTKE